MPTEPWNEYSNQVSTQIKRFELMVNENQLHFIDIDEIEAVTSHYMDTLQFNKALVALDIGISQHPFSATLLLWKSQVLISQDKTTEAIEVLILAEALEPKNSEMFILKGIINSRKNYHEDAIEYFKKAIEFSDSPENEPHLELAEEYKILGEYHEAKDALERALEMDPGNTHTMTELALCYDILKEYKRSVEFYHFVLDEDPYSYLNWFNLGLAYFNLGKIEESLDAFDYAIVIKEDFSSAYFSKACSLVSIEKYEEAIEMYKETFKYEKPEAVTYYSIAECYEELNELESAHVNYVCCTKLDAKFADAWIGISATLNYKTDGDKAPYYIKKAIDLDPGNSEYWHLYAEVNSKLNKYNTALNAFRKALNLDPDNTEIWIHYTNFLFKQGKHQEAINVINMGIERAPENASFYFIIGAYLLMDDCIQEALYFIEMGLSIDYDLHYLLYQYFPSAKNNIAAREMIDSYL